MTTVICESEPNVLVTPRCIRDLVALGSYSEATAGAIEKVMFARRGVS
jgi:hypothetical protein